MHRCRKISVSILIALSAVVSGCGQMTGDSSNASVAPAAYCPYLPSKTFSSVPNVTVSGRAAFEWRILGNTYLADGSYLLSLSGSGAGAFSATINGTLRSGSSLAALRTAIESDSRVTTSVTTTYSDWVRSGTTAVIKVSPTTLGDSITVAAGNRTYTVDDAGITMGAPLNPIRFAEVRVMDSSNSIVQCAETDGTGSFSFVLPQDTGAYKIEVASRAFNTENTAYVMRNPSGNAYYSITSSIDSQSNTSGLVMVAKASGTYEAGAFNILDQIYKAQDYLRTKTANCNSGPYQDCVPFNAYTTSHLVYTYWTPGLSPGVYYGSSRPISYYLTGQSQLFIGGGENGNTVDSDMDHFDNSVIIHEYGHFIEDHFGNPDSPGGGHDGESVIDPRLAWGEGWADFFQAAVLFPNTGMRPVYRDTSGNYDCGSTTCTEVGFNVDLNLRDGVIDGSQNDDIPSPSNADEGIFHEFSITRALYQVIMQYDFAEIWANLHGPTRGMKSTADRFKAMGRFHRLQSTMSPTGNSWATLRSQEKQYDNSLAEYATPLKVRPACTAANNAVNFHIVYDMMDPGGFAYSDLYNNNDFYAYKHNGGPLRVKLTWTASILHDLDLYIYPQGYSYGEYWSAAARSDLQTMNGTETINTSLPAGLYMINVMAYTGKNGDGDYVYTSPGAKAAQYGLEINGSPACAAPTEDYL